MKAFFKNILILFSLCLALAGCYKDLSTEASMTIPDIRIEGVDSTLNIVWGQEIKMTATVTQEGRSEEDFTYLWEIDLYPGNENDRMEI